ncbi:hypothetical protein [Mycolicibacterium sp. P9-64]|nr:hypothetical protein [Mycolicibacterium sp. P9-64]
MAEPPSASGPVLGAPDRWWCRPPTGRSFGSDRFAKDGLDFGHQR